MQRRALVRFTNYIEAEYSIVPPRFAKFMRTFMPLDCSPSTSSIYVRDPTTLRPTHTSLFLEVGLDPERHNEHAE